MLFFPNHIAMFLSLLAIEVVLALGALAHNSTFQNPILPGFHPDPSCIFVPDWDNTFFCASSSFLVFPGIREMPLTY
jgi:beta-xylosidase